ncbi:glycosyl transferase, family 39 [Pseudonocardiaceae bacterium YIM PH 21723]|nr:glycosyl transferase, family 39 [Pseudonocardiaceae bacterium YIM PH 21723]
MSVTAPAAMEGQAVEQPAPVPWGPLTLITAVVAVVVGLTNGKYGYFGDEIYFVSAGRHLDWGYADQPPLAPLLAHIMDGLAPQSVWWVRFPALLLELAGIWLAALTAREMGGGRQAQWVTGGAYALTAIGGAHLLSTNTLDIPLWTGITLFLVRWMRTRRDANLFWAGVLTALSLQMKWLIPGFWLMLGISVLIFGPRDMLRRPALYLGALVAILAWIPGLLWQARHDWPQIAMGQQISIEQDYIGGQLTFVPLLLLMSGLVSGVVLFVYGLTRLLASDLVREYRFLGWTFVLLTVFVLLVNGRPYYVMGLLPVCWAAGAIHLERGFGHRSWRWSAGRYAMVGSLVMSCVFIPPWKSAEEFKAQPSNVFDALTLGEFGWPQVTDKVGGVYNGLPPEVRQDTAIIGGSYWMASALDVYGEAHGLPRPYSPSRGYWYFGVPPESAKNVLYIGDVKPGLRSAFTTATDRGELGVNPSVFEHDHIWLYQNRTESWSELWPQLKTLG